MALPRIEPYPLPTEDELPRPRPGWQLTPRRAALMIHDLQRYFVRPFPAGESPIAPVLRHISALRDRCHHLDIPVFYTAQPGALPRSARGLQADFWGPGMSSDAADREIVTELTPAPHDQLIIKSRYSAFHNTDLEGRMRAAGRDQLIVTGVYAHIGCVVSAADAFMRDIEPFYVADAVASFSRRDHDLGIAMAGGCCSRVHSTATILTMLSGHHDDRS